jgi:DNA invertase Pin-like site-specific DNA recombinase
MFLNIICLFAEFKREMIIECTKASQKARWNAGLLVTCAKIGQEVKVLIKVKKLFIA